MEISEMEYYQLKMQVQNLQEQVASIKEPKRTNLVSAMNEGVISKVTNIVDGKPVFGYVTSCNSDVWPLMLQMAKSVHDPSDLFYMDRSCVYPHLHRPYIRCIFQKSGKVRKILDLTECQFELSAQMLNEIIPIYNRYFKLTHQRVLYDPTGKGDYQSIGVVDGDLRAEE